MKFERGNSPKKSIGIGIEYQAFKLRGIYKKNSRVDFDQEEIFYQIINGPDGHSIFEDIQKNGLKERHIPYYIRIEGLPIDHIPIGWIKGRWVEYLKKYYYIPRNDEINNR
jgi:hypothetical protein